MQSQEPIPENPSKQKQQQQQQQQQMNHSCSNNMLPSLNFDSELQNLAEMGDDVDLPEVFWDYGDISYMNNSEEGSITSSIPKWKTNPNDETTLNANANTNVVPSASVPQQTARQDNADKPNAIAGQNTNAANLDTASMNNYMSGYQQPLTGNLGGYNPFLLPTSFAAMKPGQSQQANGVNQQQTIQQQQHQQQQQQQTIQQQQQQLVNTVNILPRLNGTNGSNQGNDATNQAAANNCQQQQQQQQQQLQSQLFGLSQAAFNPQQLAAAAWQSNNTQVQNLNNYLQQQLQAQGNAQQLQQQLFSNGGLMAGSNQMLPPQQQMMQPQHQLGMQQQQQTQQNTQQTKTTSQPQAKLMNNNMQQQQSQQMYQPQVLPLAQGGNQIIPQSGGRPQSGTTFEMTQPAPVTKPAPNNPRNQKFKAQIPKPAQATSSSNIAYVVSSSDTDGEHNCASNRTQAKKPRRSTTTKIKSEGTSESYEETMLQLTDINPLGDLKTGEDEMTEEERQLANRKRNREHARNTRARKKAYVESLKSTLDELCRERDSLVSERAGAASSLLEVQTTRTSVLLSFFGLRSSYEKRRPLWSSIIDESFTCVMPVTPYRSFPASEVQISKCQRTIMGVDGMMGDTASMHVMLNSVVDRSRFPNGKVQFSYTLIAEEAIVSGSQMMARWNMTTTNAVALGAKREVKKMGMLCARFNSAHKIVALELMFDVMAFMLQLKQNNGASAFSVVPNTVQTCVGPFGNSPMVMTLAERPYTIVQVNSHWEEMTGWNSEDVVGKESCKILQGDETEDSSMDDLMTSIRFQRPAFTVLTNYTRGGKKMFRNFINLYPLSTDSKVTHYVGLTMHIEWMAAELGKTQVDGWRQSISKGLKQVEGVQIDSRATLKTSDVAQLTESGSSSESGITETPKVSSGSNDESSSNDDVLQGRILERKLTESGSSTESGSTEAPKVSSSSNDESSSNDDVLRSQERILGEVTN